MNTEKSRLWKLQISQGDGVGQTFPLKEHTRLGREPDYEIVLEDEQISSFHAVIKMQEDSLIITDQNSSNGTFVNDERIDSPTKLHQGDKIIVGETHFLVERETSTPATVIGVPPPQEASSPKFAKPTQSELPPKKGKRNIILISIILFVVGCLCVISLAIGGYLYYRYKNTTQTTGQAVDIRDFMAVSIVEIESGGTIVIPDDALLEVSNIAVKLARTPLLPDGVEPVGEALSITAPTVPQIPVTLRLPIPESVTNPENLVIIRVESDGTTTFLMTDVDGNELVASTPGFSNFIVALLEDERKILIGGKQNIRPGQREQYSVKIFSRESRELIGASWSVAGEAMLVNYDKISAIIQADQQIGSAILSLKVIDQNGYRWFGTRYIEVTTSSEGFINDFGVSVILYPAVVEPGENVQIVAEAYGDFEVPLTWIWEYGDGTTGSVSSDLTRFDLPPKTYNADKKRYQVHVRGEDSQGRFGEDYFFIQVVEKPFQVALEGPLRLKWQDAGAFEVYTAITSGGVPPYRNIWTLSPGGEPRNITGFSTSEEGVSTESQNFSFEEPGEYILDIVASDTKGETTHTILPIIVEGGEDLSTRIVDIPTDAPVKEAIEATISIRGGTLVVSGKKGGYSITVDWDDGKIEVEENVGAAITPYEGVVYPMSHTYSEVGTYTVMVEVTDPTGTSTWTSAEIEIVDRASTTDTDSPDALSEEIDLPAGTYTGEFHRHDDGILKNEVEINVLEDGTITGSATFMIHEETNYTSFVSVTEIFIDVTFSGQDTGEYISRTPVQIEASEFETDEVIYFETGSDKYEIEKDAECTFDGWAQYFPPKSNRPGFIRISNQVSKGECAIFVYFDGYKEQP